MITYGCKQGKYLFSKNGEIIMKKLNQNNIDTKKMTFGQRLERYIEKNGKAFAAIDAAWTGRLYGRY